MTTYELAQVNVAVPLAPLDGPVMRGFVERLAEVNALADAAPGFVWRLQTEDGDASAIRVLGGDVMINLSVWRSPEDLGRYVYGGLHLAVMRQRRAWFAMLREAYTCAWWVPAGHRPGTAEAEDRLLTLRADGPTPAAFTLRQLFPAPSGGAVLHHDEWRCGV